MWILDTVCLQLISKIWTRERGILEVSHHLACSHFLPVVQQHPLLQLVCYLRQPWSSKRNYNSISFTVWQKRRRFEEVEKNRKRADTRKYKWWNKMEGRNTLHSITSKPFSLMKLSSPLSSFSKIETNSLRAPTFHPHPVLVLLSVFLEGPH